MVWAISDTAAGQLLFLPHHCLSPQNPMPHALVASNCRISLRAGRTFGQLSLTEYYKALALVTQPRLAVAHDEQCVYYPLRQFSDQSLLLPDGSSIVTSLCRMAPMVVVEDVDLTAASLRSHLAVHGAAEMAATEVTDRMRMQSARLLCVSRQVYAGDLPGVPV